MLKFCFLKLEGGGAKIKKTMVFVSLAGERYGDKKMNGNPNIF